MLDRPRATGLGRMLDQLSDGAALVTFAPSSAWLDTASTFSSAQEH